MGRSWARRIARLVLTPVIAVGLPTSVAIVASTTAASPAGATTPPPPGQTAPPAASCGATWNTRPLTFDADMTGCLDTPGHIDTWDFTVDATTYPQGVYVRPILAAVPRDANGQLNARLPRWSLRADNGDGKLRPVFTDKGSYQGVFGDAGGTDDIPVFLKPRRYVLTVMEFPEPQNERSVGPYSFNFHTIPNAQGPTAISLDQLVSGNLEAGYAVDTYSLDLTSAQRVYPLGTANLWALRNAAGRLIFDQSLVTGGSFRLAAGNYSLSVYQYVPVASAYTFTLSTVPPAGAISSTTPPAGMLLSAQGSVASPGAVSRYAFSGTAGTTVDFDGLRPADNNLCDWRYTIAAPSGAHVDRFVGALDDHWYIVLPDTGQYVVSVSEALDPNRCTTGGHKFTVQNTTAQAASTRFKTATQIPSVPGNAPTLPLTAPTVSGSIAAATAENVHYFKGTAGQRVYLKPTSTTPVSNDLQWLLYGPDGVPLSNLALFRAYPIDVTLPVDGIYALEVRDTDAGTWTGSYQFDVNVLSNATPTFSLGAVGTSELTVSSANNGTINGVSGTATQQGAGSIGAAGEHDVYTFSATAGQVIYPRATPDDNFRWDIRGPDGVRIDVDGEGGYPVGPHAMVDWRPITLVHGGTYTIDAYHASNGTGNYAFTITPVTESLTEFGDLSAPNATVSTPAGTSLALAGERDVYTFTANSAESVYFRHTAGISPIRVLLYDPAGFRVELNGTKAVLLTDSDSADIRLQRGGLYTAVVAAVGNPTGSYGFSFVREPDPNVFSLPSLSGGGSVTVPANATGSGTPGVIDSVGATDVYTFSGRAGQTLSFSNVGADNPFISARLLGPDGALVNNFDRTVVNLGIGSVTLPRDGQYTLLAYGWLASIGNYHFTVNANATFIASPPTQTLTQLQLNKNATAPLQVTPGNPEGGAGIIEGASNNDVIPFHATGGDAVDIEVIKDDLNLRSYGVHQLNCGTPSAPTLRWTLRDPSGVVLLDQTLFGGGASLNCQNGATGPMVFARSGTYTITLFGTTTGDSYDLSFWPLPPLRTADPGGGAPSGSPTLTRVTPTTGAAGGSTTIQIYGKSLPAITAVTVGNLPVNLGSSFPVDSTLEALGATATVDLTGVTSAGNYPIRVYFLGGGSVQAPQVFHVATGVTPHVDISLEHAPLLSPATTNYVFVNVANSTDADYWHGIFFIDVPCDGTSTGPQGQTYATTVRLVQQQPPSDFGARLGDVEASAGVGANVVQAVRDFDWSRIANVAPTPDEYGDCNFFVYEPRIASHSTRTIRLEVVPPTPQSGTVGRLDRAISVRRYAGGTHAAPNAPDAAWRQFVRDIGIDPDNPQSVSGALSRTAFTQSECKERYRDFEIALGLIGFAAATALFFGVPFGWLIDEELIAILESLDYAIGGTELLLLLTNTEEHLCPPDDGGGETDPTVGNGHDPNDLYGDATVLPGDRVHYTADFENVGPGNTAQVDVMTTLDPNTFDLSTFRIDGVGVGNASTTPTGNAWHSAQVGWPVNGAQVDITSSLDQNGHLDVELAGEPNQFEPLYGDFLPANTGSNKPNGQGYVRFSVALNAAAGPGTAIDQQADVIFNQHVLGGEHTPTNSWHTDVVSSDHPISGAKLKLQDFTPTARLLDLKVIDTTLNSIGDLASNGLSVRVDLGTTLDAPYVLPGNTATSKPWRTNLKNGVPIAYKYTDPHHLFGPITGMKIDLVHGKLTLKGKGTGLTFNMATPPPAVGIDLFAPGGRFCAEFNTRVNAIPHRFMSSAAPAPSSCR